MKWLQTFNKMVNLETYSGTKPLYDKKTLLEMYKVATEEPYSFLYVKLTAKKKEGMFYKRFSHKLVMGEGED